MSTTNNNAKPSLHYSFVGKRVLVTAGYKGIGKAVVEKFYNDGAIVFVIGRDATMLENLKKELPKVVTICVDLLNWDETKRAVESLAPLDHLVNNAGFVNEQEWINVTPDAIDRVLGVNYKAVVNCSQAFVKGILDNKINGRGATIVNISSIADRIGIWGLGNYNASKGALSMSTKSMALEFGRLNGIRVNCVNPAFIPTDLVTNINHEIITSSTTLALQDRLILRDRPLNCDDIADAVLFLSSPLSAMITGQVMYVDAGTCAF